MKVNVQNLFTEVEENTTSRAFSTDQFGKIGLQFTASSVSSGNGVFAVDGTIDGQNWVRLNMLVDNVVNSNAQSLTRVASKTLSSNTSAILWLQNLPLKAIRAEVLYTTDGKYSCDVIVQE